MERKLYRRHVAVNNRNMFVALRRQLGSRGQAKNACPNDNNFAILVHHVN